MEDHYVVNGANHLYCVVNDQLIKINKSDREIVWSVDKEPLYSRLIHTVRNGHKETPGMTWKSTTYYEHIDKETGELIGRINILYDKFNKIKAIPYQEGVIQSGIVKVDDNWHGYLIKRSPNLLHLDTIMSVMLENGSSFHPLQIIVHNGEEKVIVSYRSFQKKSEEIFCYNLTQNREVWTATYSFDKLAPKTAYIKDDILYITGYGGLFYFDILDGTFLNKIQLPPTSIGAYNNLQKGYFEGDQFICSYGGDFYSLNVKTNSKLLLFHVKNINKLSNWFYRSNHIYLANGINQEASIWNVNSGEIIWNQASPECTSLLGRKSFVNVIPGHENEFILIGGSFTYGMEVKL